MPVLRIRRSLCLIFFLFAGILHVSLFGQTTVTGKVTDAGGDILPGANVYLKDTYDGATSDTAGVFKFKTTETGEQTLVVSYVGYEAFEQAVELTGGTVEVDVKLKEEFSATNTVLITAGGFGANDEVKAIVLNPLDIVTTAGANGDVFGALQYLPGTQAVGEENGLFVRGGAASETVTIIDEMVVQRPFFSTVPDIPSRARFNPFLFKGTFFSTGGYSARYGQAMSSALV
ncbi:MAG: carboxypeptidase-like regulatory domain-containing protein, partial [Bacteroidota bacterium]